MLPHLPDKETGSGADEDEHNALGEVVDATVYSHGALVGKYTKLHGSHGEQAGTGGVRLMSE